MDDADKRETRERHQVRKSERGRENTYRSDGGFRGDHKDLQGHVYTYDSAARANQYEKTTKKITEWAERELPFVQDIWGAMSELEEPNKDAWKPTGPAANATMTKVEEMELNEEFKEYVLRKRTYENNKFKLYSIVLGQCSEAMKAKLEGQDDWEEMNSKHDLITLLKSIKVWMLNQQADRNPVLSTYSAVAAVFKLKQQRHEELSEFRKRFTAAVDVLKHIGVDLGAGLTTLSESALKEENKNRVTAPKADREKAEKKVLNKLLAVAFIQSAEKARYQQVSINLENEFLKNNDQYPADVTQAYSMLDNWKSTGTQREQPAGAEGLTFAQDGRSSGAGEHKRTRPRDRSRDVCHSCGLEGHHQWEKDKCEAARKKRAAEAEKKPEFTHAMVGIPAPREPIAETSEPWPSPQDEDDETYQDVMFCMTGQEVHTGQLFKQVGGEADSVQTNSFNEKRVRVVSEGSIGLDSMSTVDIFADKRLLRNVRFVDDTMYIACNAGTVVVRQKGDLPGYGPVWYHENAIANILSLSNLQRRYRVTFDSKAGNQFVVHRDDGSIRVFKSTGQGLYTSQVLDVDKERDGVVLVTTVDGNKSAFPKRQVRQAEAARRLQQTIGRPSDRRLKQVIAARALPNCTVTAQDVDNARLIFGPDIGSLKGKTVRKKADHVDLRLSSVPSELIRRHKAVAICFDVMYVQAIPFLVSISRSLKFCTVQALANRRDGTILECLKKIAQLYKARGFVVMRAAGDNEFASLETQLAGMGITINVVARGEHVPEIERHIRTLKERVRATVNTLPFRKIPPRMIVELVYAMSFWIHALPAADGVSKTMSPREIVSGVGIDAARHCRLPFGTYVQTHEEHDNSMKSRAVGAIALRPTGNAQGAFFFLSLETGKRISRYQWTEAPMPADAIRRVHVLAGSAATELVFGDRNNQRLEDDEDVIETDSEADDSSDDSEEELETEETPVNDLPAQPSAARNLGEAKKVRFEADIHAAEEAREDQVGEPADEAVEADMTENMATDETEHADHVDENGQAGPNDDEREQSTPNWASDVEASENDELAGVPAPGEDVDGGSTGVGSDNEVAHEQEGAADDSNSDCEPVLRESRRSGLRTKVETQSVPAKFRPPKHQRGATNTMHTLLAQVNMRVIPPAFDAHSLSTAGASAAPTIGIMLTQYGMSKGLRLFGQDGDDAVRKEMQQLHDREVMRPRPPTSITNHNRGEALRYLMFLKQKRDGSIKGRGCADGRKQREHAAKHEVSSPTISTEAVFIIVSIAAKERRDVATVDIPGAFLQTDLDEDEKILIRFEGRMAELLAMIDPKLYRQHIAIERGKSVLYAELKKALYGIIQASLRFWDQIVRDLTQLGYVVNPYDWCVMNKEIDGRQHTIGWHVDDFIITHEDPSVNTRLIDHLQHKYGKLAPLTVHRGDVHEYLGMNLDFSKRESVVVTMYDYITRLVDEAPADFGGEAVTPAARHLFEIDEDSPQLDQPRALTFHHLVAKTVYLAKRARPDLQLAVGFLSTRVTAPTDDDWKKLKRMIQYIRKTHHLPLTLMADHSHVVKWWVDAAFAVHADMRSQTGGMMTMGRGAFYSGSTKQKLNTKSSTEAELVGVNDFMAQVLWTRYFLECQGYAVEDNIVYQDNESAILLEKNGKGSSSKRTRHINIRFFFVTDRINARELSVSHCPTGEMTGDFFTKPLQGALFTRFRNAVLNLQ